MSLKRFFAIALALLCLALCGCAKEEAAEPIRFAQAPDTDFAPDTTELVIKLQPGET